MFNKLRTSLSVFALLAVSPMVSGGCLCKEETVDTQKRIVISNDLIKATILSDSIGCVSSMIFLPENMEIMMPYKESRKMIDPLLPEVFESNNSGAKQWVWGKKPVPNIQMGNIKTSKTEAGIAIAMDSQYYMSENIYLLKELSLEDKSSLLSVKIKVKNKNQEPYDFALWENIIPMLGKNSPDTLIIPCAGNVKEIDGRKMLSLPEDTLLTENSKSETVEGFFAPARPWLGRFSEERDLLFVVSTRMADLKPAGFFYRWKNNAMMILTQEIIFSKVKLAAGEEKEYLIEYMLFPGLKNIRELCGRIAIDCDAKVSADKKLELKLSLCAAKAEKPETLKLELRGDSPQKSVLLQGEITIPELQPGKVFEISKTFSLENLKPGKYSIAGTFKNGAAFELIAPRVTIP